MADGIRDIALAQALEDIIRHTIAEKEHRELGTILVGRIIETFGGRADNVNFFRPAPRDGVGTTRTGQQGVAIYADLALTRDRDADEVEVMLRAHVTMTTSQSSTKRSARTLAEVAMATMGAEQPPCCRGPRYTISTEGLMVIRASQGQLLVAAWPKEDKGLRPFVSYRWGRTKGA